MNPLIAGLCLVAVVIGLGAFLTIVGQPPAPYGRDWLFRAALALLAAALMGAPILILIHYGSF